MIKCSHFWNPFENILHGPQKVKRNTPQINGTYIKWTLPLHAATTSFLRSRYIFYHLFINAYNIPSLVSAPLRDWQCIQKTSIHILRHNTPVPTQIRTAPKYTNNTLLCLCLIGKNAGSPLTKNNTTTTILKRIQRLLATPETRNHTHIKTYTHINIPLVQIEIKESLHQSTHPVHQRYYRNPTPTIS